MNEADKIGQSRDKLMSDLRVVIRDAEELLAHTGQQAGEGHHARGVCRLAGRRGT